MNPPPSAGGATAGFPTLHPEIIDSHILSRLDGPALASVACCSASLRRHSSDHSLWLSICHRLPRLSQLISTFPGGGPRAFFSHAFPLLSKHPIATHPPSSPPEILSAVDIHYDGKLIFTKLHSTDTSSDWFRCSPFRADLKEAAPAAVKSSAGAGNGGMHEGVLTLSWIVIDPVGRQAANLSSHEPVSVADGGPGGAVWLGLRRRRWRSRDVRDSGHVWQRDGVEGSEDGDGGYGWEAFEWGGEFGHFARGVGGRKGHREEQGGGGTKSLRR